MDDDRRHAKSYEQEHAGSENDPAIAPRPILQLVLHRHLILRARARLAFR